jgi:hypothetical protein
MNFSVRNSRVTGPKMRVPMGSNLAFSNTAALPSNLTREPSAATNTLGRADHHCAIDLAFFDAATRSGFLDAHLDDVANAGVATPGPAEHLDAQDGLRAGVVGNV